MKPAEAVVYLAMIVAWVFGIATAIVMKLGGWVIAATIFLPPAAWVVLAIRVIS